MKKPSNLENLYKSVQSINGEQKPVVLKNHGSDEWEITPDNSLTTPIFSGNFSKKALDYSDNFEKSMKRGINKNWWRNLVDKT